VSEAPAWTHEEILAQIGLGVFKLVYLVERCGWSTPSGGLPYFHGDDPAVDLVRWCNGDEAARDRLIACLPDWKPFLLNSIANAVPKAKP